MKRAGSFEIDGLPPGRYRAFALVQDEAGSVEDPLVARNLAGWSNRRRSEPETTTLALQPAPRLAEIE